MSLRRVAKSTSSMRVVPSGSGTTTRYSVQVGAAPGPAPRISMSAALRVPPRRPAPRWCRSGTGPAPEGSGWRRRRRCPGELVAQDGAQPARSPATSAGRTRRRARPSRTPASAAGGGGERRARRGAAGAPVKDSDQRQLGASAGGRSDGRRRRSDRAGASGGAQIAPALERPPRLRDGAHHLRRRAGWRSARCRRRPGAGRAPRMRWRASTSP